MELDITALVNDYWTWLHDTTQVRNIDSWYEITTPYLDRHNDCIQLYAKSNGDTITLTDNGYTVTDLEMSGCAIDTPKRTELLESILTGFGVRIEGKEIFTIATPEQFALRKHNLIQAILSVNDLFFVAGSNVRSLFVEDAQAWLDSYEIRYISNVKFGGKSGFDHVFEFDIPKSRNSPERLIKTINNPSRDTAQSLIMAWLDTQSTRMPSARAYALLNDRDSNVPEAIGHALRNYSIHPIRWRNRDSVLNELAS